MKLFVYILNKLRKNIIILSKNIIIQLSFV